MNYHNLTYPDMNNGSGLRVVLWLSGCSHKCKGCQNPQTWDANSGIPFDEQAKEELFRELNKDYISGLTLTGGDPLYETNLDGVLNLVNEIRLLFPLKSIWLYTGYVLEEIMAGITYDENGAFFLLENNKKRYQIISQCDVVIDGRYIDEQKNLALKWRGSRNQRVIDMEKTLQKGEILLWKD